MLGDVAEAVERVAGAAAGSGGAGAPLRGTGARTVQCVQHRARACASARFAHFRFTVAVQALAYELPLRGTPAPLDARRSQHFERGEA